MSKVYVFNPSKKKKTMALYDKLEPIMLLVLTATFFFCIGFLNARGIFNPSPWGNVFISATRPSAAATDEIIFTDARTQDANETPTEGNVEPLVENISNDVTEPMLETEPEVTYQSLGQYKLTAYCSCAKCCGKWASNRPKDEDGKEIVYTASGARAEAGYTVAADTRVLPYGSVVYIDGHAYEVQDCGNKVKGNHIDIYFDDHDESLKYGVQYSEVFVLA